MDVPADRIEINPKVMLGKPVVRGTRITVELLLGKLSEGATEAELLQDYPRLTAEDIRAAIKYAADVVAHEEVITVGTEKSLLHFLADLRVAGRVCLQTARHDVAAIVEELPGMADDLVLDRAVREGRVLITKDTDFGELVYAHFHESGGVILLRFPAVGGGSICTANGGTWRSRIGGARRGRCRRRTAGCPVGAGGGCGREWW
jgi:uncharacterized protein (DUF433 family)